MRPHSVPVCLVISIALCSSALGAVSFGDNQAEQRILDNNFYAASNDDWVKSILDSVERHHLFHSTEADRGGVMRLMQMGKFKHAIAELKYVLDRIVNHPMALHLLGQVARAANDLSLPIEYFERAIRLYPGYAFTHAQYGTYLVDIGSLAPGIAQLQKAIELDPRLASAHAGLARAYLKSGKPELARQAAQRARELGYKNKPLEQIAEEKPQSEE